MHILKVPEIVVRGLSLRDFCVWLRLRGMNDIGELDGVLNEKNGNVVPNNIPIALLGVELDGKAPHITNSIGAASGSQHCRESEKNRCGARGISKDPSTRDIFGTLV